MWQVVAKVVVPTLLKEQVYAGDHLPLYPLLFFIFCDEKQRFIAIIERTTKEQPPLQ